MDELHRARFEVQLRIGNTKKSVNNSLQGLKKSLSFANLVTSMFADATLFFTEAEYIRRGYLWLRDFLDREIVQPATETEQVESDCGEKKSPPEISPE